MVCRNAQLKLHLPKGGYRGGGKGAAAPPPDGLRGGQRPP